jgi:hypothetical protein
MELPKLSKTQIYQDAGNNTSEDLVHQSLKMKHVLKTTSQNISLEDNQTVWWPYAESQPKLMAGSRKGYVEWG